MREKGKMGGERRRRGGREKRVGKKTKGTREMTDQGEGRRWRDGDGAGDGEAIWSRQRGSRKE